MPNYMIIKGENGWLRKKEMNKTVSSKPYFTIEDNVFTGIFDSKMIEEYFESKNETNVQGLKINVSGLLVSKTIQQELRELLKNIGNDSITNTMVLVDFFEKKIGQLERKIIEINLNPEKNKADNEIIKRLNRRIANIESLLEILANPENEEGKITEETITTINDRLEKLDISNTTEYIENISNNPNIHQKMNNIFKRVLIANNQNDINDIYEEVLSLSNENKKESLVRLYENNTDIALSIMTKELLKNYIQTNLRKVRIKEMYELEKALCEGVKGLDILANLDPSFNGEINPEVAEYLNTLFEVELDKKLDNESTVICFNCTNGYTSRCQKIADIDKEEIQNYPFIVRGYQVCIDDRLDKFIVGECKNFSLIPTYNRLSQEEYYKERKVLSELFHDKITSQNSISKQLKKYPKSKRIQ